MLHELCIDFAVAEDREFGDSTDFLFAVAFKGLEISPVHTQSSMRKTLSWSYLLSNLYCKSLGE